MVTIPVSEVESDAIIEPIVPRKIGIPKEIFPGENRVATTPETAKKLQALGFTVLIEHSAGENAGFSDSYYEAIGCQIMTDAASLWEQADIILKVRAPQFNPLLECHEAELLTDEKILFSFIWPAQNPDLLERLAISQATVFAMDAVPRISRAQKLDALSSMANIAGYRAVIEAANHFGRFFSGQITAAGKIPPAKLMVIGAGVAGLAAISTARGLGAVVRAFDTRPVVKDQVQSLGAEFLELDFQEEGAGQGGYAKVMSKAFIEAEMALFAEQAQEVDIIITTALIPGKKAPLLITQSMVESMKEGSVIVDMAAEQGGNCEVTHPGEIYRYHGVTIIGIIDFPSRMAAMSSQLYGTNLWHFLKDMGGTNHIKVDLDDEVIRGALVSYQGEITWSSPKPSSPQSPAPSPSSSPSPHSLPAEEHLTHESDATGSFSIGTLIWSLLGAIILLSIGFVAPASFLPHFTVFVLACIVGWKVVWNVTPSLHTPLMSVTNAISGIIIIGGMLQISGSMMSMPIVLGALAIFIGTINISGGFLVTQRMLKMFQK